ncbi:hypothetical protein VSS37_15545 [Candidatus Thiothrix sp. Deng01]|uniref:Uncharacterized protein n=1 Tax=Candidatus Thiothrix phosphatis TaxID=3112415 RepID=A0ABU6D046_9GAMM|nr:hypothetical protein [Candidatus Thiothrix sp. Deng01]MEB4592400.1 hypothetical protein [Candidatus Thiothrix sp. Deng01]
MATNKEPYEQNYYPPVPTPFTLYTRCSVCWQFFRFIALNIKMMKVVMRSKH